MYIFAKAQENLKAAELLIANAMYASSIHCSYYASLQLSKRKLMESGGLSYDQQDQEVKKQQTDTHNFVIFSTENCVTYISINEKEVVLRLTSINTTEDSEMRFNYDILDIPQFNEISKNDYTELISSYALAA